MAHKKAGGSTSYGRDSQSKRLGVKLFDGQPAKPGMILVRQRGTKIRAGLNVKQGVDDTMFSTANGKVKFTKKRIVRFDGSKKKVQVVNVLVQPPVATK